MGLLGQQNSSDMEMKERRERRGGNRRSSQGRRWDRHRRVSERRMSTPTVGVDNRSRVDRRVGKRRTDYDQRWEIERRAFAWVREGGAWMIAR